ncbi:MAG: M20/M25/M40 family metallo-hydrolase [Acidobacteria bacterium]|nr:M20/M25/M40 family metallo-hydrolase [Acidobacteriota bacterium]
MKKLLLFLMAAAILQAQLRPTQPSPYRDADRKIFAEVEKNNELMANLEYLCDMIGPRLTGSDKLRRANEWTMGRLKDYGLDRPHLEAWTIGSGWLRGTASARIVEPTALPMTIASAGWAAATNGPIRGRVIYVKAERPADLEKYKGQLKGMVVLTTEPARVDPNAPVAPDADQSLRGERGREEVNIPFEERMRLRRQMNDFYKNEGALAVLRESSKEHGLLNMTGSGGTNYQVSAVPSAFIIHEDYARLWRLLEHKLPVEVEIDIKNDVKPGPIEVYNTVAEITGGEKAEEIVIVGAHLDSWDLGAGATDNGTGSSVALEAARAIHALGVKPKRTIRFILFAGEEQGLNGSRAYIKAHPDELDKIQGVVIHDTGTGRVKSFTLEGRYDLREALDKMAEPLREAGLEELSMRRTSGSDHVPFRDAGVPAFFGIQDAAEYRKTHHSQSDTFDKIRKADLEQGAKVVAALAWNLAEYPEKLPRKKVEPAAPSRATQ